MYNSNIPTDRELPSTQRLITSTILAAVTAVVLLITVVMPAEYGIDPTGIGNALGLETMGEMKVALANEAATDAQAAAMAVNDQPAAQVVVADHPASAPAKPTANVREDEMKVALAPNEGTEIKVTMARGKTVAYSWSTDGGRANFDVHGDSKELKIDYHGYGKGSEQRSEGVLEAAFDGNHGWFWRNRTSEAMTVTLRTSGEYTDIKQMK